jgi:hypothetical protein
MSTDLWSHDEPIHELDIDVPRWIDSDITPADVAAILQGGCASGAYMPAVTYHQALATMSEHGDDVLQWLEDYRVAEVLDAEKLLSYSWAGMACYLLSAAVEDWARHVEDEVTQALDEREEEEGDDAPEPEDYVLSDAGPLGSLTSVSVVEGPHVGTYASEDEALQAIRARMDTERFWPNVWRQGDHGGLLLLASRIRHPLRGGTP